MTGPWSLLKLSNIAHPWTPPGGKKIPERALELLGNRVQGPSSYLSWQRPRNSQQHPTNRIRFHSVLVFPFRLFIKSQNTKWGKDLLYYINIWLRAGGGMWLLCNFHQESPAPPPLGCNPWGNGALQEHMTIFWLDTLVGQAALFFESPWECRRRGSMFGDVPHVGSEAACTELHDAHVVLFPCCVCTQPWFRWCTRSLLRASRICVHLAVTASWSLRWKRSSPPTWCTMTSTSMRKWRWRAAPFRTCLLCRPIARRKATKSSSNTSPTCPSKSFNQSREWVCLVCKEAQEEVFT